MRRIVQPSAILLALLFCIILNFGTAHPVGLSQSLDASYNLSYQVFDQLQTVDHAGGVPPSLVSKANAALDLLHDAAIQRSHGNVTESIQTEATALTTLQDLLSELPLAQEQAQAQAQTRTTLVVIFCAVSVMIATFALSLLLAGWRWYEKEKLSEMIIVETKTLD